MAAKKGHCSHKGFSKRPCLMKNFSENFASAFLAEAPLLEKRRLPWCMLEMILEFLNFITYQVTESRVEEVCELFFSECFLFASGAGHLQFKRGNPGHQFAKRLVQVVLSRWTQIAIPIILFCEGRERHLILEGGMEWDPFTNLRIYSVTQQVIGWDFSENIPGVASFAFAVGISAGWLGNEASSKSKHTKALPTTCWVTV